MEAPVVKKYSKKRIIKTLNTFDDLVKENLLMRDVVVHGMTINEYETDWMPMIMILFGSENNKGFTGLIKWYCHRKNKYVVKNRLYIYFYKKNNGKWSFQNTFNDIYSSEVFCEDIDEYGEGDRIWHPFKLDKIDIIEK